MKYDNSPRTVGVKQKVVKIVPANPLRRRFVGWVAMLAISRTLFCSSSDLFWPIHFGRVSLAPRVNGSRTKTCGQYPGGLILMQTEVVFS